MSDYPTLIVDAPHNPLTGDMGTRFTVRIDGPLPTVGERCRDPECHCNGGFIDRPLRVDDRVILASKCCADPETCRTFTDPGCCWGSVGDGTVPFATATVTDIDMPTDHGYDLGGWLVTVTDVEAL